MADETKTLEEMTLKELQDELTAMDFAGAEAFTTKAQVISVITSLKEKEAKVAAAPTAAVDPKIDNESTDSKKYFGKAAAMKAALDAQPKVDFIIPLGFGEKKGAIETWQANGYRLNILKGVRIKLPMQVADSLAESYNLTAEAGSEYSLDRPGKDGTFKTVRDAVS